MTTEFRHGDTELSRVLRKTFGRVPPEEAEKLERVGLGNYDTAAIVNTEGRVPGTTYHGGPQRQRGGPKGTRARKLEEQYDGVFNGIDRAKCPPWMTEECLDVFSRLLEQTFRNFQLHTRLPSHIDPPFTARPIDAFPAAVVSIPAGAPGAFTTVTTFTMPVSRFRGVIVAAGQSAENATAFGDLEWQILVDGTPFPPWDAIFIQLWEMVPPTLLCSPLHLRARQTITLQARSLAAGPHDVLGRLCGWLYPVRSETGDDIRATIVD